MSSDALGAIVDRLIQKYGKAGLEQLKTATFTREQLMSPSLDPDRYAFLVGSKRRTDIRPSSSRREGREPEKVLRRRSLRREHTRGSCAVVED